MIIEKLTQSELAEKLAPEIYNNFVVRILNKLIADKIEIKQGHSELYIGKFKGETGETTIYFETFLTVIRDVIKVNIVNLEIYKDEK